VSCLLITTLLPTLSSYLTSLSPHTPHTPSDEVESITSNRSSSVSSNEPGDAVRVVNAVLTSLDALKRRPNVLVLCTSNMQDAIDPAFRDRVDLEIFLGPPSVEARYKILQSCLEELSVKQIISPPCLLGNLDARTLTQAQTQAQVQTQVQLTTNDSLRATTQGQQGVELNQLEKWAQSENEEDSGMIVESEEEYSSSGSGVSFQVSEKVSLSEDRVDGSSSVDGTQVSGRQRGNENDDDDDYESKEEEEGGYTRGDIESVPVTFTREHQLLNIALQCDGYSGRSLRKLPLKAHAMYLQRKKVSIEQYLNAIATTIEQQKMNDL
jgi:SpoVK/Ycf46/Vps4 family AAA+-type ATPase